MRRALRGALTAGLFAACSQAGAQQAGTSDGPLIVGADVGNAPYIIARPDGTYDGFDVERLAEIAKRLGRPGYKLIDQQWSGIFAGLNAKRFDFIMASTVITRERSESVLFTEGDHNNDYRFLVRKASPEIKSMEDLRGKTIAVNQGNVYDQWVTERAAKYDLKIERYAKNEDAVQAVLSRRADANLASTGATAWTAMKNPQLVGSLVIETGQTKGMVFRKDDVALRNQIENIVECMKLDGTIARLQKKWLGVDATPNSSAMQVRAGYGEPDMGGYDPTPHTPKCN
jgi:polar amino acid transport system substrate-binding protein